MNYYKTEPHPAALGTIIDLAIFFMCPQVMGSSFPRFVQRKYAVRFT